MRNYIFIALLVVATTGCYPEPSTTSSRAQSSPQPSGTSHLVEQTEDILTGSKEMNAQKKLIGNEIDIQVAVDDANLVVVAKFIDLGQQHPAAPGQCYFENTKVRVFEILKGTAGHEHLFVSFPAQLLPDDQAVTVPEIGESWILFLTHNSEDKYQAFKMLPFTDDVIKSIKSIAPKVQYPGLKATADSSTDIIVAEVLDTNPSKSMEGARDTVELKVVRTLKGPLEPGQQVGVYYHLLWVDTEKLILEKPKFEKGKQYTVFLINNNGYTLTDQWLAVLPKHPRLAMDVALSLNEVGDLWSDYWRRQQKGAVTSKLRIDIVPDAIVARTKDGLVLSVKIVNHSSAEIRTRLAHERHGGEWPPTDLYASASHVQAKRPSSFEPVYLKGEKREKAQETRIAPGKAVTVDLRMDWPGTGSVQGDPLMTPSQSEYNVRLLMVFSSGQDAREYAVGASKHVRLAVK